jgi:hypothetical protein
MTIRYAKTAAGREAIQSRAQALSRPARTLLVIIDASRTGDEWLGLVVGTGAADLEQLLAAGFIEPALRPATARVRGPGLEEVLQGKSYRELYDLLTEQARSRLCLIKGYRMVLEIEKCAGAEQIRRLAVRFVDEVRAAQGDAAARAFCKDLGADLG